MIEDLIQAMFKLKNDEFIELLFRKRATATIYYTVNLKEIELKDMHNGIFLFSDENIGVLFDDFKVRSIQ